MESFFTRTPQATWPRPTGRLHIYAPVNAEVTAMAARYQGLLAARGLRELSRQPARWLHMSVEHLTRHLDELTPDQLETLTGELRARLATVPAFSLQVGPALVSAHSITLDAFPDQPWRQLRRAARSAAVASLGDDAVAQTSGPGQPHVTVSYCTGHVDIEPHLSALSALRVGRAELPVQAVHLAAVEQHVGSGTYTWTSVAQIPLMQT
ncbi:2'-5' RNA ligase family protein [Catellatospora paridis]|uniref:2'-5' RNA ligase family protein n=1 Tax=Catellatospora paridis TaxID=1617086 RepID=UPI0012D3E205|nr:2'-5' RNA ligase family protein [Catellatospora paridis]